jgi:uncharacterized protein (TIGR04255 family)
MVLYVPDELDPNREVYPNAPLRLVACEIVYVLAPGTTVAAARDAVYERLSKTYPLPAPTPPSLTVQLGPEPALTHQAEGFRFLNLERTRSLAVSPVSLLVESSQYHRFEEFLELVMQAVEALASNVRVAAVSRIGIRYIDELPLTELPEGEFDGYFTESVLAPGLPVPDVGRPEEFMTTSRFTVAPDTNTVMRTGVLRTPVVSPEGPLSISRPTEGPFFLIDIDSAWQAMTTTPRRFEPSELVEALYSLHAPVRALFEHAVTDKLRAEVLRKKVAP